MIHTSHRVDYFRGWKYLLSGSYREDVHRRWESELPYIKSLDIAGGVYTVLITACGTVLAVAAVWGLVSG